MGYQINPFTGDFDATGSGGGGWNGSTALDVTANGAASTPALDFSGTWFTGGTATTTKPQLLIEPSGTTSTAWSTSGTGLGVNAASGFTGNLLDLQINGVSRASLSAAGILTLPGTSTAAKILLDGNGTDHGLIALRGSPGVSGFYGFKYDSTTDSVGIAGYSRAVTLGTGGFGATPTYVGHYYFGLSSTGANPDSVPANTFEARNSTSNQTWRMYDTFTSYTNYHRLAIGTARATLSNVSGASVTATGLIPDGAVVVGVTSKVTTGLGTGNGTTGYQIGDGSDVDRWGAITGTASGTSSDNTNWTATTVQAFTAATDVIVTATGGNFNGTGVIYLSVQYLIGQAD